MGEAEEVVPRPPKVAITPAGASGGRETGEVGWAPRANDERVRLHLGILWVRSWKYTDSKAANTTLFLRN